MMIAITKLEEKELEKKHKVEKQPNLKFKRQSHLLSQVG